MQSELAMLFGKTIKSFGSKKIKGFWKNVVIALGSLIRDI